MGSVIFSCAGSVMFTREGGGGGGGGGSNVIAVSPVCYKDVVMYSVPYKVYTCTL